MKTLPTLVVVSGPPGTGKTTLDLARLRIVHCTVGEAEALARQQRRWREDPVRRAHEAALPTDVRAPTPDHRSFDRVSIDAPWIEVDTTQGYQPSLDTIVAFLNSGHC